MKLIFNDATDIIVQQVESHGDYLQILTVGNTPEQLKVLFTDSSRTARMIVQERGQTVATYLYREDLRRGDVQAGNPSGNAIADDSGRYAGCTDAGTDI